jgi:hypothetical protein
MKVGSLVELVDDNWIELAEDGEIYPIIKIPYTIRNMQFDSSGCGITLEEIINEPFHYAEGFGECNFDINRFRELMPPIENIEEYIKENVNELKPQTF